MPVCFEADILKEENREFQEDFYFSLDLLIWFVLKPTSHTDWTTRFDICSRGKKDSEKGASLPLQRAYYILSRNS